MLNGMRGVWLLLVIACLALGWWLARPAGNLPSPPPSPTEAASTSTTASGCPMPPRVARGDAPLQTELASTMSPFHHPDASLVPLAGFSVEARVLGSETYRMDREAAFAPLIAGPGLRHRAGQKRHWVSRGKARGPPYNNSFNLTPHRRSVEAPVGGGMIGFGHCMPRCRLTRALGLQENMAYRDVVTTSGDISWSK